MDAPAPNAPIVVALKWVDLRPDVDRLTGTVHHDDRFFGASAADLAALEWALRIGEAWDRPVVAVTVGPAAAETLLRDAVAAGAASAYRIDAPASTDSAAVAAALAAAVTELGSTLVCCGDWSIDRGSGSVPPFAAAHLDWGQALGVVGLAIGPEGTLTATRRLDGGRREVLAIDGPVVTSFEGASAELRRAPLGRVLAAGQTEVQVSPAPPAARSRITIVRHGPDRPRARELPPPDPALGPRGRILALTGALVDRTPPRTVVCDAEEGVDLVLDQLREWGYLT